MPLPFGPTTAVTPGTKSIRMGSAKDLNPFTSSRLRNIRYPSLSFNQYNHFSSIF
ncbi:hypothetical protein JCM19046_4295 [Bacillus sp. JCM 19046]|nr:hypothetical protein JCM19046_4295 [Bacillus sp. JCM 19046]